MTLTERSASDAVPLALGSRGRIPAIAIVMVAGLALRLAVAFVLFPGQGFRDDLRMFEDWAETLATYGPGGFYRHVLPPGQSPGYLYTPGYMYILWAIGDLGHAVAHLTGQSASSAIAALIKLPAIGADLIIAALLYRSAARWWDRRAGRIAASLYLFIPITWYDSAVWGQVDAVGTLLLLGTLVLLVDGWSEPAAVGAVLAAVIKPQYGIGLVVVGVVLIGRHLVRPGSGPTPIANRPSGTFAGRVRGWFGRQGPERLISSFAAATVVLILILAPFDLAVLASARFADIPVVNNLTGFLILIRSAAGYYPYLTANAFNVWAFIGPTPLVEGLGHGDTMTLDSIRVIGPVTGLLIGASLLALAAILVGAVLALQHDRASVLVGFTVIALAFFVLPTRSHERYLFPALASGALLGAVALRWRWWLIALGLAQAANVHAVLTLPQYGSTGIQQTPFAAAFHTATTVAIIAAGQTLLLGLAVVEYGNHTGRRAASEAAVTLGRVWRRLRRRDRSGLAPGSS